MFIKKFPFKLYFSSFIMGSIILESLCNYLNITWFIRHQSYVLIKLWIQAWNSDLSRYFSVIKKLKNKILVIYFLRRDYIIEWIFNAQIIVSDKTQIICIDKYCVWYVIIWNSLIYWWILNDWVICLKNKLFLIYLQIRARGKKCHIWDHHKFLRHSWIFPKWIPYNILIGCPIIWRNIDFLELAN